MNPTDQDITFLSPAAAVHMADEWFQCISPDHFWIRRRAEVVDDLYRETATPHPEWLDVGCGTGLFQAHLREKHGIEARGVDLNLAALRQNRSGRSHVFCYDINDRDPGLKEAFDIISLLDVLEHIEDEDGFLLSLLFHLRPGGRLIGNVPAFNRFYSRYDKVAGHQRRYSFRDLERLTHRIPGVAIEAWTYWGGPLLPLLVARNLLVSFTPEDSVIETGFSVRSRGINGFLRFLSTLEGRRNLLCGTSLAFVLRKH
jgi:SAM-dependent methyltransferase